MKPFLTITDADFGLDHKAKSYRTRTAARAILQKEGKIALLYVAKYDYHKLPGGGIEENETLQQGLQREVMEEVGCRISNERKVGEIIEYRNLLGVKQTSHCYIGDAEEVDSPTFTNKEIAEGFQVRWLPYDEAIKVMQKSHPEYYKGKFTVRRDLEFLIQAKI